jgi:hypothetical protein
VTQAVRDAACHCGRLTVRASGDPTLVSVCHCQACQRRTGSALGAGAFYGEGQLEISGESATWERDAESGARLAFHFCPTCGSNVFWTRSSRPGLIAVAVGAFADPSFPGPSRRVWTEFAHDWIAGLADLPTHLRQPG